MAKQNPRVELSIPRVDEAPKADCCVVQIAANPTTPRFNAQSPVTFLRVDAPSSAARSNYILQDKEEEEEPQWYNTMSIMQEAMLACVDISKPTYIVSQDLGLLNYRAKPTFKISAKQLSTCKIPMTWFCEMTNSILGEKGKLLKYWHLTDNPKTKAVWAHLYGNKIGQLAQGILGRNTGMNTIFFIQRNQVPCNRMKDTTYGLITCLVRPEKIDKPNRTRLVAGGD
jgi:hypothetical protein